MSTEAIPNEVLVRILDYTLVIPTTTFEAWETGLILAKVGVMCAATLENWIRPVCGTYSLMPRVRADPAPGSVASYVVIEYRTLRCLCGPKRSSLKHEKPEGRGRKVHEASPVI